ncbi:MAG: hypothetical protein RR579_07170 [Eubacterium sp.]
MTSKNEFKKAGFSSRGKAYTNVSDFFSSDRSFEGELVDVKRKIAEDESDVKDKTLYSFHTFVIKKGMKTKSFVFRGHKSLDFMNYFQIGDHVRHFSGYAIPEKFDKTSDDVVLCIVCGDFTPINRNHCQYCGELLLK